MNTPSAFPDWATNPPTTGSLNEQQTLAFNGTPVSGTYVLGLGTATTVPINWNDDATAVETKINAIYTPGTATVTGGPAPTSFIVDFGTASQTILVPQMTAGQNTMLAAGGSQVGVTPYISQASQLPATVDIDAAHTTNGWSWFEFPPFNVFNKWMNLVSEWIRSLQPKGENIIRNGGMQVAQRGATGTVTSGTTGYTVDGWMVSAGSQNVNWEVSQNILSLVPATGISDIQLKQRIESNVIQTALAQANAIGLWGEGKNPVFTFQALISIPPGAATPTLAIKVATDYDSGTYSTVALAATNLQKITGDFYTVAYTLELSDGFQWAYGIELTLDFGSCNVGFPVYATNLDFSSTPTLSAGLQSYPPLPQVRTLQEEFEICKRYLRTIGPLGMPWVINDPHLIGFGLDTTTATFPVNFGSPMRTQPTPSLEGAASNWEITTPAISAVAAVTGLGPGITTGIGGLYLEVTVASGLSANTPYYLILNTTYLLLMAEL